MGKRDDLVAELRTQIQDGTLLPGSTLRPIRLMAQERGMSKNTVVDAYDRLVAEGRLMARRGSGFLVLAQGSGPAAPTPPPSLEQAVDSVSLLKAQLDGSFDVRVGDGRPPKEWMTGALPRQLPPSLWHDSGLDRAGYGSAYGDPDLRERIARRQVAQGVSTSMDGIVTTFGANHALDLVIRRYLLSGSTVLVDDPGYYPLFAKLRLAGVTAVGVRRGPDGPDLADLAAKVETHRPTSFFTQSRGQNPTGTSMNARTAHGVLAIAQAGRMMVVDDDPFIDLPGIVGTRLAALDAFGLVVTIGTYAKILHAGLRVGYVMAEPRIVAEIAEMKMLTCVNTSRLSEAIVAQTMASRRYDRHLARYADKLSETTATSISGLSKLGLAPAMLPGGGLYTWVQLPDEVKESELAQEAACRGIFLAPGRIFRTKPQVGRNVPEIRVNLSRSTDFRFFNFLYEKLNAA